MAKKVTIYCKTNGKIYNSITEAANEAGIENWKLSQALQRKNSATYNGFTFSKRKYRALSLSQLTKLHHAHCKAIICETTGKQFESQKALCEHLGLNQMSVSTTFKREGKFVDAKGNVYVRKNPVHNEVTATIANNESNVNKTIECAMNSEQANLQDTLVSFIKKGMYSEASALCETMQKIYMKK